VINIAWDDTQSTGDNITATEWNTMVSETKRVVTTKTAAYTAVNRDIILMNGAYTVTLPSPSADDLVDVKNIGTGTVQIDAAAGDTIDGDATIYLYSQYESVSLVSDGTNWFMI